MAFSKFYKLWIIALTIILLKILFIIIILIHIVINPAFLQLIRSKPTAENSEPLNIIRCHRRIIRESNPGTVGKLPYWTGNWYTEYDFVAKFLTISWSCLKIYQHILIFLNKYFGKRKITASSIHTSYRHFLPPSILWIMSVTASLYAVC